MAFKLKLQEPLDQGVRRVALGQIDGICDVTRFADAAQWVHEARKSLKRTRALLRLVRSGIAKDDWRWMNAALRDAGRGLSPWRDRDVRRETLAWLSADADPRHAAALDRVVRLDSRRNGEDVPVATAIDAERAVMLDALGPTREKLSTLEVEIASATLVDGLARTHRTARKVLQRARSDPGDEAFHELRKLVQLHWRQMQLLSNAWPALFAARIASARALAQSLGREHDLAVLAAWIASAAAGSVTSADRRLIGNACVQAQAALRETAIVSAHLLFAGHPRSFAREAIASWDAAQSGNKLTIDQMPPTHVGLRPQPRQRGRSAAPLSRSARSAPEGGGGHDPVRSKRGGRAGAKPAGRT